MTFTSLLLTSAGLRADTACRAVGELINITAVLGFIVTE